MEQESSKDDHCDTDNDSPKSDERMRKLLVPNLLPEHVIQIVRRHYASEGQSVTLIKQLDSYDDQNFVVQIGDEDDKQTCYLLKVHNGVASSDYCRVIQDNDASSSHIHLQNAMIEALTRANIGTTVPVQPLLASSHLGVVVVEPLPVVSLADSPTPLVCRLLTWVPGSPMSSVRLLPLETLAEAGRFLARIHNAFDEHFSSSSSTIPNRAGATAAASSASYCFESSTILIPARRYHQWDGQHTADLTSYLPFIPDARRRSLIASIIEEFQTRILDGGANRNFRRGINHGDFNDANILVNETNYSVSGVIDFGDSTER
jgi:Ser/Thr protein kinase RdoA (MazF antagonist)